jgi:hypothetical protein
MGAATHTEDGTSFNHAVTNFAGSSECKEAEGGDQATAGLRLGIGVAEQVFEHAFEKVSSTRLIASMERGLHARHSCMRLCSFSSPQPRCCLFGGRL